MFGNFIRRLLPSSKKQVADRVDELERRLEAFRNATDGNFSALCDEMQTLFGKLAEQIKILEGGGLAKNMMPQIKQSVNCRMDRLESIYLRRTPKMHMSFSVGLVEHCNLGCAGCDHFSPIAEKEFADINEFAKDFKRLAELFPTKGSGRQVKEIQLMGGEPLLHPDIISFMQVARECFPNALIEITTNGVLLGKMDELFWEACKKNGITIHPTKYPINLDWDALESLAAEKGVAWRYYGNTEAVKTMGRYPLDLKGLQDERRSFMLCYRANQCTWLQHGRIYTCTVAPTIRHFNKKYGTNLQESPDDSIDIYKAASAEEIMNFLTQPIPFCKYCMPAMAKTGLPWRPTNFDILEWTL